MNRYNDPSHAAWVAEQTAEIEREGRHDLRKWATVALVAYITVAAYILLSEPIAFAVAKWGW